MSAEPDIDIEAEQKLFEDLGANEAWHLERYDSGEYKYWNADCAWKAHIARARLAAERERELIYLLRDVADAMKRYEMDVDDSPPFSHRALMDRITETLKPKGPSDAA